MGFGCKVYGFRGLGFRVSFHGSPLRLPCRDPIEDSLKESSVRAAPAEAGLVVVTPLPEACSAASGLMLRSFRGSSRVLIGFYRALIGL